jgi:hypothetical protein
VTDQQILIEAIEKAGVVIADHIDPWLTQIFGARSARSKTGTFSTSSCSAPDGVSSAAWRQVRQRSHDGSRHVRIMSRYRISTSVKTGTVSEPCAPTMGVPFDPTGQRIHRDGHWCVYEFARQLDAMMFWDKFEGRWMRHNDFFYPDRPDDMPLMKTPPIFEKLYKKNGR